MKPSCPWPGNPVLRFPVGIAWRGKRLAVNSNKPIDSDYLHHVNFVSLRCRLCPCFFEGECHYPKTPSGNWPPALAVWAFAGHDGLTAATEAATQQVRTRVGNARPSFAAIVMLVPGSTSLYEISEALELVDRQLSPEGLAWHLDLKEEPGSLVFLCAWLPE